jgi:signal peptidase I
MMNTDPIPSNDLPPVADSPENPATVTIDPASVTEKQASLWNSLGGVAREIVETILLTLVLFFAIRFAIQNFRVEGFSMEPNFQDGQFIFVNKIEYMLHPPERGDPVVLVPPSSANRDFIKRIIGLPGERIEVVRGKVVINGKPLQEPYPLGVATYSMPEKTVSPDEYFVLGDNRDNSSDSHIWGTVARKEIVGKVWVTYWPPKLIGFVPMFSYGN